MKNIRNYCDHILSGNNVNILCPIDVIISNRIKILLFGILLLLPAIRNYAHAHPPALFYVGTFTSEGAEGIYLCKFYSQNCDIKLIKTFKGIHNPSFIKISPDKNTLYAVTRMPEQEGEPAGFVEAYHISNDGELTFLNKQNSNGSDPCHVDVSPDGNLVAIATYGGGSISLYPIKNDGRLLPASSTISLHGSGPDISRQSSPHAHSIKFSTSGEKVFNADLGTDQLNIFRIKNKKLIPDKQKQINLAPGAGPRHFVFNSAENTIYVINELNSTVTTIQNINGNWRKIQIISTLHPGYKGENYCADIHISNNGNYVYASNRGHNSITIFKVEPDTKKLKRHGSVPCHGDWPRNFALSPDNNYILVANQKSANITVFKIDTETGMLKYTGHEIKLPAPVCIEFMK